MREIFAARQIDIGEEQERKLRRYYELLTEWNGRMNLTAITEYEEVVWKHFVDSASILSVSQMRENRERRIRVLDMGTGAGFPGMVLAILCPAWQFTLIDSLRKRIDFLREVKEQLQIENVKLFHGRAEDYGQDEKFRGQFDYVVSRAVAELSVLMEYCIPFVREGGFFVSYKGKRYREELEHAGGAFAQLNCALTKEESYTLADREQRHLLFIQKQGETDRRYPRKPAKIKSNPL